MPVRFILTGEVLPECESTDHHTNIQNFIYIGIAAASIIGSSLVALTIFYNKKLQTHPSPLIAYICMCEAVTCFNGVIWALDS